MMNKISKSIDESSKIIQNIIFQKKELEKTISIIVKCLKNNHKVVIFGNGGSAADAQHIAGELIGRFKKERKSFAAIALTTDTSIITALANDYSFDDIFQRQCEGLVQKGDVVIGISTSGNSINVIRGLKMAKKKGAWTVGLLGKGGKTKKIVDISLTVNSTSTPKIQEAHRVMYHIICEEVEKKLVTILN